MRPAGTSTQNEVLRYASDSSLRFIGPSCSRNDETAGSHPERPAAGKPSVRPVRPARGTRIEGQVPQSTVGHPVAVVRTRIRGQLWMQGRFDLPTPPAGQTLL